MTSTPPSPQPDDIQANHANSGVDQVNRGVKPRSSRFNSIGIRLFLLVMVGASVGLAGMAYVFYNILKEAAQTEIQSVLSSKVGKLDGKLGQSEALAKTLRDSVLVLHQQKARYRDTYVKLAFEIFKNRPKFVTGLGFGQRPYGILPDRKLLYPYFYVNPGPDALGKLLPAPYSNIRYADENTAGDENYLEADYWKNYALPKKPMWTTPYRYGSIFMSSFYTPIFDAQNQWLGVVSTDFDATSLNEILKGTVVHSAGEFLVVAEDGLIVALPSNSQKALDGKNYQSIPGLKSVWTQIRQGQSGLVSSQGNYWAYERIPTSNWIALAAVPRSVVVTPVALVTIGGTVAVALLLALIVVASVRYLNHRLQPILDECNKLAATDARTQQQLQGQDEIGRLSLSFFNLLDQLSANEQQLRQEVARAREAQAQVQQQTAQIDGATQELHQDVGHILQVVSAAKQGDLTVRANEGTSETRLVTETLNQLFEQLAQVLRQVLSTAQQVTQSSQQVDESAKTVTLNAQHQAEAVTHVLHLIEQVQQSAQDSIAQVDLTDQLLEQVQTTVARGQAAIESLKRGIQVLHGGTHHLVLRAQDLNAFAKLTDQFLQEQIEATTLIQSLAVNAGLLSARTSVQQDPEQVMVIAREFESIAKQIQDLATQASQSLSALCKRTQEIHGTVSSVNIDLQSMGGLVGSFTRGVEQSTQAFDDIQEATEKVVQSSLTVAQVNQAIAQSAETTTAAMQEIAQLAEQTAQLTQTTQEQSEQMGQISEQLLQRIQFFRLLAVDEDREP
jgi:twitching motility protein PilJ